MNSLKNSKFLLLGTIIFVFIINVLQGFLTELLPDEAYYWIYSQHMDWGFFDHPPLVAVWISISDFFFANEIGVRFFSAISFSFLIYIVWKTIDHPRKKEYTWLFLLIILSTALLNVYGFITTPDTPLMLFCALFLYAYKEYLNQKNLLSYVLLAVSIAGMMYSKYQGILIVFFVFLSNWKLVKDYKLLIMALGALLLYIPHLNWQWENDWLSFKYHLEGRVFNRKYKTEHTIMHFVNAIAIIGLTFPIMYHAFFKNIKTKDAFQKALNFIIFGFIIFFFISSFRGRVQAQWVVPISIPLVLITFNFLMNREKSRKWFVRLAFLNIGIMIIARVLMFTEGILPQELNTHGNEAWALELQSKTKDQKKFFINSYQNTATYWYYTKERPYYMKNFTGRNNHFIWMQSKEDLSADKAAIVSQRRLEHSDFVTHLRRKDSVFTSLVDNYADLSQLKVEFLSDTVTLKKGIINEVPVEIEYSYDRTIDLQSFDIYIGFIRKQKKEMLEVKVDLISNQFISKDKKLKGVISLEANQLPDSELYPIIGIGAKSREKGVLIRLSKLYKYTEED